MSIEVLSDRRCPSLTYHWQHIPGILHREPGYSLHICLPGVGCRVLPALNPVGLRKPIFIATADSSVLSTAELGHPHVRGIMSTAASSPEHLLPNDLFERPLLAVPRGPSGHPERTPSAEVQCLPAILSFAGRRLQALRRSTALDDQTTVISISSELSSPSSHNGFRSFHITADAAAR